MSSPLARGGGGGGGGASLGRARDPSGAREGFARGVHAERPHARVSSSCGWEQRRVGQRSRARRRQRHRLRGRNKKVVRSFAEDATVIGGASAAARFADKEQSGHSPLARALGRRRRTHGGGASHFRARGQSRAYPWLHPRARWQGRRPPSPVARRPSPAPLPRPPARRNVRGLLVQLRHRDGSQEASHRQPAAGPWPKGVAAPAAQRRPPARAAPAAGPGRKLLTFASQGIDEAAEAPKLLAGILQGPQDAGAEGPPEPTLTKRAASYSDFYRVVRAQLAKDGRARKTQAGARGRSREALMLPEASAASLRDEDGLDAPPAGDDAVGERLLHASQQGYLCVDGRPLQTRAANGGSWWLMVAHGGSWSTGCIATSSS